MSSLMKRTVLVLACVVSVLGATACHTVSGVGQDTQSLGRDINRAAK